jgi:competence protein ComFC
MNLDFLLDLLYPPSCASCGSPGAWWCADCRGDVERLAVNPCPRCLCASAGHDRAACGGSLPFAGVVATGYYHSPSLRKMIGDLKFRGVTEIRRDLAAYLRTAVDDQNFPWISEPALAIQPVPLAPRRERERGFNQSAIIADVLREALLSETETISCLSRVASRTPQANIEDHALRAANVSGEFVSAIGRGAGDDQWETGSGKHRTGFFSRFPVGVSRSPIPPAVLLVDDVVTSGSTSGEAARALLAAGAERVYLFALALS